MWIPRFSSAFRRRLRSERFSPAALAAMAQFPAHRAPSAADLRDELAARPPGPDAPLEEWGAQDIVYRDGAAIGCSLSGRAFIAMGTSHLKHVRLVAIQPFMAELVQCPQLAMLERLDLTGNRIGVAGVAALAGSPYLGNLRELVLSGNKLGDAGLIALRTAPWFDQLRVLELADNGIGVRGERRGVSPTWSRRSPMNLLELDLSKNSLGPRVELPSGLQRLNLAHCNLGETFEPNEPWGSSPRAFFSPRILDLGFNDLTDAGIEAFADAEFECLQSLDLSGNRLTRLGAAVLAESPALAAVRDLNLTANPIGDDGALSLMRSEALGSLRRLNLANCGITDAGVQKLAASGTLGGLHSLSLAWNAIGAAGIRALAACPDLAGLQELDLTGTAGFLGRARVGRR